MNSYNPHVLRCNGIISYDLEIHKASVMILDEQVQLFFGGDERIGLLQIVMEEAKQSSIWRKGNSEKPKDKVNQPKTLTLIYIYIYSF